MKRIVLSLVILSSMLFGADATVYERMLEKALVNGNIDKAKKMIKKGANINAKVYYGGGYYLITITNNRCKVPYKSLKFMYNNGYNISLLKSGSEISLIRQSSWCKKDGFKRAKLFFDNNLKLFKTNKKARGEMLQYFADNGVENRKQLLKTYKYITKKLGKKAINEYYDDKKFIWWIWNDELPTYLKILVQNKLLNLNEKLFKNASHWTGIEYPLDIAIYFKDLSLVKYMIKNGSKITNSALKVASKVKDDDIEMYLVEHQK